MLVASLELADPPVEIQQPQFVHAEILQPFVDFPDGCIEVRSLFSSGASSALAVTRLTSSEGRKPRLTPVRTVLMPWFFRAPPRAPLRMPANPAGSANYIEARREEAFLGPEFL